MNHQLKMELLKEQHEFGRVIRGILPKILLLDPGAVLQPLETAVASRSLVKKLWDMLPDEQHSHPFMTIAEQTAIGKAVLPGQDLPQLVTLHLGWDILCFSCTLEAAWESWKEFAEWNTDTYNACIYPANLEWYLVRAGNNLYPMRYAGEKYELMPPMY